MEQQRASNALEPYVALSKSATSPRAAADLISQATSSPQTYFFAELLQTPNIQALRQSPEYSPHLRLLEIFAWGTYHDYIATPNLPPLNPQQHQKLLLLSLIPLCTSPSTLTYTALQQSLFPDHPNTSDLALESLVTTAIYSGLLTASLDPLHRTVRVTSIAPLRDLAPNSVPTLMHSLDEWEDRCMDTLTDIENQIAGIRRKAREEKLRQSHRERTFEEAIASEEPRDDFHHRSDALASRPSKGNGGFSGGGGGGVGGSIGKMFGLGGGKGGKRAAPGTSDSGGSGGVADAMDLDDGGAARGNTRGVKRQGRAASGTGRF